MNPLTVLFLAACTWVVVLESNAPVVSGVVLVLALLLSRKWTVALATFALSLPIAASLLVVHGTFGHWDIALNLALRAAALTAVVLAAFSRFSIADLAKALQGSGLSPKLSYAVAGAMHTLPMGKRYAQTYAEQSRQLAKKGRITFVVFPLVTRMLVHGSDRALAARLQGVELSGKRTLLRPIPFTQRDVAFCFGGAVLAGALCLIG